MWRVRSDTCYASDDVSLVMRAVGTLMVCDAISRSVLASPARGGVEKTACGLRDGGVGKKIISIQLQPPIITTTPQSFEKWTRHFSKSSSPSKNSSNLWSREHNGKGTHHCARQNRLPVEGNGAKFLTKVSRTQTQSVFLRVGIHVSPSPAGKVART